MAQTNYTPIQLYYSTTASAVPTSGNLANGELGLNIADMKLYAKNSAGVVTLLASNAATSGVSSFQTSLSGLTPSTSTTGAVTLAGTLGTSSGGTNLTSFTSGGVVYASSTSALATGSALTFDGTNLSTTGQILLNNNNYVGFKNTSGTAAASIFNDTSNFLNLYNSGNTGTIFYVNAAEQMRLTSTGLGIKTSSVGLPLSIGASGTGFFGSGAVLNTYVNSNLGTTLDSSGNLGIGTTTPAQKFHINSASGSLYALISSGANNVYVGYNSGSTLAVIESNNSLAFNVGSSYTERLRIASTGAFGLSGANYGSAGEVLTSGGSGAAPTWAAAAGGISTGKSIAMAMIFGF